MKDQIHQILIQVVKGIYPQVELPVFSIAPTEEKYGDYATNIAMVISRAAGEKPAEIAAKIIEQLKTDELFDEVSLAGPGFINFKIALPYFQNKIKEIIGAGGSFGRSDLGKDLKVNLEFISANPTGPLTLGNGRNAYFGDCLGRVLESYGAVVEREYYVNDRGVQILALGHSVLKDSEAVYKGDYIDELRTKMNLDGKMVGLPSEAAAKLGEEAAAILLEDYIKKTIQKMGIKFNIWYSEKSLHESGAVPEVLGELETMGLTYKKEDAVWLKTQDFGDDKDRVLITGQGEYTYFASDIAYHFNKMKRGYNLLIDFWGADHHGYISRLNAAVEILRNKIDWSGELKIMICQLVKLMAGGKEVRMSKRAGNFVLLDELIDEVGPDVTRFFFLDRTLDTHMDFDLDLAKEKSDKNPVFYVQYAYARINSILGKVSSIKNQVSSMDELSLLKEPAEIALIKQLIKLPELVEEIAGDYQVQKLAFYARDLATSFHHFYENCPVVKAESEELVEARVQLLYATKIVLKNTLDLLGVSAPEKM